MVLTIGIDVGTQSTKGLLYDDVKKIILKRSSVEYGLIPTDVPGRAEQNPEQWIEATIQVIKALLVSVSPDEVVAIGVSGQQHGLVALDENDQVIRPAKLWCDVESKEEAKFLSEKLGFVMVPSVTLTKILWMKNKEPENFARLKSVLLPHDYVNFRLTGNKTMECGDAGGVGALDLSSRSFDKERFQLVDENLETKIPPLIGPSDIQGRVKPEVCKKLGLSSEVVVSAGSGDNMMSALGSGAVTDGTLVLSLGTSGCLFACSAKPIFDPTGVVCPFCDATGKWLPLVCTISCTGILAEIKQCFQLSHEELTALAEKEPIGCRGVNFLPYLNGERTPNWPMATGALLGLSPGSLKPGLLYRAAMEGATFTILNGLKTMEALGVAAKELRLVGGGSKNPLWRRIVADAFQVPLKFPLEPESAALGAALQAGAAYSQTFVADYVLEKGVPLSDQTILPNPENAALYQAAFERHVNLGVKLFGS